MAGYLVDVKATNLTASGAIFAGPARVLGIYFVADTTAGSLTFKNGTSGATVLTVNTPLGSATAGEATVYQIEVPGDGLYCSTNAHVTLAGVNKATVFYQ